MAFFACVGAAQVWVPALSDREDMEGVVQKAFRFGRHDQDGVLSTPGQDLSQMAGPMLDLAWWFNNTVSRGVDGVQQSDCLFSRPAAVHGVPLGTPKGCQHDPSIFRRSKHRLGLHASTCTCGFAIPIQRCCHVVKVTAGRCSLLPTASWSYTFFTDVRNQKVPARCPSLFSFRPLLFKNIFFCYIFIKINLLINFTAYSSNKLTNTNEA